ncbi:hypothetical protein MHYP_G00360690 [Metynnis hypsauchen]
MASGEKICNRTFLLCPLCKTTQRSLPTHLRVTCMKGSPEAEISSVVYAAKTEAIVVLQHVRSWEFGELQHIMEQPNVQQVRREVTRKLRTHLMCPVCKNTSWSLPLHLRRVCLKRKSGADIKKLVTQAKHDANEFLRHGYLKSYRGGEMLCATSPVASHLHPGQILKMAQDSAWLYLGAAKSDFIAILRKLKNRDACPFPTSQELLIVLYYLEATVILCHLQRPAVVKHMTES